MMKLILVITWLVQQVKSADCQALATHDLVGKDFSCGDGGISAGQSIPYTNIGDCNTECYNMGSCYFFEITST